MQLRRTLAALSLTAVVALAGCSGAGSDQDGSGSSASDQGSSASGQQAQAQKPDVSDVPAVVAVVDGHKITKKEFVAVYGPQVQQAAAQQQQGGAAAPDEDTLKKQVVEQLVGNRLLLDAAHEAGFRASDQDVNDTLDEIAKQNGLTSGDDVIDALKKQGETEKSIRKDAASQYEINGYLDKKIGVKKPTDKQLKKQYEQLKKQSASGGQQQSQGGQQQKVPAFKDVKDQLAEQSVTQQRNQGAEKVVKQLRKDADVTIKL